MFYLHGFVYFNILNSIVLYAIAINAFFRILPEYGVPMIVLYAGAVVLVIVGPVLMGLANYRFLLHHEQTLAWEKTPGAVDLNRKIDEIHKILKAKE
jgi:ACR3 family arsenite efflux pump ArsB